MNGAEQPETLCQNSFGGEVCGIANHVYDNGIEQVHGTNYTDACTFCTAFDENGFWGLRGTKWYVVGYTEGVCK